MTGNDSAQAACLTPPAPGGIAVIQVVGGRAPAIVAPFLRAKRALDLERLDPSELRLCRVVDSGELIDDALISMRQGTAGESIIDISLHGGPRVVQRVLVMLQRAGARIVKPAELISRTWPAANTIEQEGLTVLLRAKTRAVALWLVQMGDRLPARTEQITRELQTDHPAAAQQTLATLLACADKVRYLLEGVRVVLIGESNVGKSSLANALAEREHAIVSDTPGTTRDWVEHPAAVEGVPFTFVDTAGIRETTDPIEQEALRRTRQQMDTADLVLRVMDASQPLAPADREALAACFGRDRRDLVHRPKLLVWNKSDLARHPDHAELIGQTANTALTASARTGAGLSELRRRMIDAIGLADWPRRIIAPFTQRQREAAEKAFSALTSPEPDRGEALAQLGNLVRGPLWPEDPP